MGGERQVLPTKIFGIAKKMVTEIQTRKCRYCGSYHLVRYGHSKEPQRLLCRHCGSTFMDIDALPGMKTAKEQVASALNMYYEGVTFNAICRHLQQNYNSYLSSSTIYEWIGRFTKLAVNKSEDYKPVVGDVWIAGEIVLKIEGRSIWFWDIIDIKTRFLLASLLSVTRSAKDAQRLMELALERAGKLPKVVVTDKLDAYLDYVELAFGAETRQIHAKKLTSLAGTQLIEHFRGTLKEHAKVMRGLKRADTLKKTTDGWLVHYNFFSPNQALEKRTPAAQAGIKFPYKNWMDVI